MISVLIALVINGAKYLVKFLLAIYIYSFLKCLSMSSANIYHLFITKLC